MQEELLHIFPLHLRETLQKVTMKDNTLEEIRIRIGQPVIFHMENEEWYLKKETGRLERSQVNAYCATKEDIRSMVKFISSYSLYAYEDEMGIYHHAGWTPYRSGRTSSDGRWQGVKPVEYLLFEYPCGKRKAWMCKRHYPISGT